jgi:hypothetical protein
MQVPVPTAFTRVTRRHVRLIALARPGARQNRIAALSAADEDAATFPPGRSLIPDKLLCRPVVRDYRQSRS